MLLRMDISYGTKGMSKKNTNQERLLTIAFRNISPYDVESVINKVCIHFEVHKETLMGKSRTSNVVVQGILYTIFLKNII